MLRCGSPGDSCTISSTLEPGQSAATSGLSKTSAIKVLRELKKIKMAWPDLNYTTAPGLLILLALDSQPSRRSIKAS